MWRRPVDWSCAITPRDASFTGSGESGPVDRGWAALESGVPAVASAVRVPALAGLVQARGSAEPDRARYPTGCCTPTQKDRSCRSCSPILRSQTLRWVSGFSVGLAG